jgi:hypothetical protein
MDRNSEVEGALLGYVTGQPLFLCQVLERLKDYEEAHGNSGWERPVVDLLEEVQEELADVAGWSVGVAYQLEESDLLELAGIVVAAARLWDRTRQLRVRLAASAAPAVEPVATEPRQAEVTPLRPDYDWAATSARRARR